MRSSRHKNVGTSYRSGEGEEGPICDLESEILLEEGAREECVDNKWDEEKVFTWYHIYSPFFFFFFFFFSLEPGIGQFREFEPRRVHTRINLLGLFLVHKLTCGKRESVS